MIQKILIVFILFAVSAHGACAQEDSTYSTLKTIETLYNTGSYLTAEMEARRLLEYSMLNDSVRVAVHKYIAFSLIAQGKSELAKEHFMSMLNLAPDYDLDPVYTSPKILVVFKETQQHFLSSKKPQKDTVRGPVLIERPAITYRTIIFPGWEQLHQDRKTAGTFFLGAGITTLGAGIAFEFLRSSARQNYLSETHSLEFDEKYDIYNRYYKAEIFSFVAFAVVYAASEIDVFQAQSDLPLSFESNLSTLRGKTLTVAIRF
ncbi:MAG: hypothetical protein ABSA44_14490 [Bacteroidota bacterium]|jgi:hypothetical protein